MPRSWRRPSSIQDVVDVTTIDGETCTDVDFRKFLDMSRQILGSWGASPSQIEEILGQSSEALDAAAMFKGSIRVDLAQRFSAVLFAYAAMLAVYPKNPEIRKNWAVTPDGLLGGLTPLDIMLDGLPGLSRIRDFWIYRIGM